MTFKVVIVLAVVTIANAGYISSPQVYHAGAATLHNVAQGIVVKSEEYDPHPQYQYSYGVEDKLTGDSKSQYEERNGDVVNGEYSLIDADGYKRTIKYTADAHNGFNAVVRREPHIKTVSPVSYYAAPAVIKSFAPVSHHSTPTVVRTNPVAHYVAPSVARTAVPVTSYKAPAASHFTTPTVSHYAAPVAHYSAPHHYVSYSSPVVSYRH